MYRNVSCLLNKHKSKAENEINERNQRWKIRNNLLQFYRTRKPPSETKPAITNNISKEQLQLRYNIK